MHQEAKDKGHREIQQGAGNEGCPQQNQNHPQVNRVSGETERSALYKRTGRFERLNGRMMLTDEPVGTQIQEDPRCKGNDTDISDRGMIQIKKREQEMDQDHRKDGELK